MKPKFNVGEIVDVVIDKRGREWPIIKLHDGIYGFRDCPLCSVYNESKDNGSFEESDACKAMIEWIDENMTPDQLKRLGKPFIASLYNIIGKKAYELTNPSEGEIQFDYYKDWHNRVKSCPDLSETYQTEFGARYWTSSPYYDDTVYVCGIILNGNSDISPSDCKYGIAPCFKGE